MIKGTGEKPGVKKKLYFDQLKKQKNIFIFRIRNIERIRETCFYVDLIRELTLFRYFPRVIFSFDFYRRWKSRAEPRRSLTRVRSLDSSDGNFFYVFIVT